jgi:hypothetical protein
VPPFVTIGNPIDCMADYAAWFPPAEVEVGVDQDDSFCFRAVVETNYPYPATGSVQVDDPSGWVTASFEQDVTAGCGVALCGWNYTAVTVPVHVPSGVPDGTTNEITVRALLFDQVVEETTVTLRAVSPVTTEASTWGLIKALYHAAD